MLLTIFGLVYIIISETLLFSNGEEHTFTITAYCNPTFENSIFAMPEPINAEAKARLAICMLLNHKSIGLEMKGVGNRKHICTYTLLEGDSPLDLSTKDGKKLCGEDYSEIEEEKKKLAEQNAIMGGANEEEQNAKVVRKSGKEMKKKGTA